MTRLSDFDYELPRELIAQKPLVLRDRSRLLHLSAEGDVRHRFFSELPEILDKGDLLVLNDTKVFPARLLGTRGTKVGGACELLLLDELGGDRWRVLAKPARKIGVGARLVFGRARLEAEVEEVERLGRRIVRFHYQGDFERLVDEIGSTPLPPYIEPSPLEDETAVRERYQTVYARPRGSVAAPTAGLHFTEELFRALDERGVDRAFVTLHVGYATFEPVRVDDIEVHRMGSERFVVPQETKEKMKRTKARGRRVVAVGTTTVRALESAALEDFPSGWRDTELFIRPGFSFRVVDALLTNFHLPRSSLLVLVSALGGREQVLAAYREAVEKRYRFYTFGDAMLLYRSGLVR